MAGTRNSLVQALLDRYGRTYAEELGAPVAKNTPAPLFQLLCMSMLLSARIKADNAMRAARALLDAGLTTPQKMADAPWQDRVDAITWHGYKRYDERTATMLGKTADALLDRYGGDLRRLRADAACDVRRESELLQRFSGIAATGAAIFLREAQIVWDEAYPFADERVLKAARRLELGRSAEHLAELVPRQEFARLAAALVRVDLDHAYDEIRRAA